MRSVGITIEPWLPWLDFFVRAVTGLAIGTIKVVEAMQDLQRRYRERFQTARRSALIPRIIDLAFAQPVMTVTEIATRTGTSYKSAANNIAPLVAAGRGAGGGKPSEADHV